MTNTTTARRLAITPGEAKMADGNKPWVNDSAGFCIADFGWDEDRDDRGNAEALANATLYADAHNTYQACHLTPSELLARLREAEKDRDMVRASLELILQNPEEPMPRMMARAYLAKHKPE